MDEAKRVLVTGVAGFLGSRAAEHLLKGGFGVVGCDNLLIGKRELIPDGVEFTHSSVQEFDCPPVDAIVHCAAIARSAWGDPQELWEHNVGGTRAVAQMVLDRGARLVHASSSVVHVPDSSVYARTKTEAEEIALSVGGLALRFGNIYGRGQIEDGHEPNVIAAMRRSFRESGSVRIDGNGTQKRNFVHVDDAARAIVLAVEISASGWLDICSMEEVSVIDIARKFTSAQFAYAPSRNDPSEIPQNPERAKWILGWEAQIPFDAGIWEMVH